MIVSLLERPAGTAADYGEPFVYRDIHAHIPVRMRIRLLTFGVLVRRVGSACWFGVLVLPARQGAACWYSQRDRERRVVLPARQGAACCVLVLPARQGAACWSSQRDRERCVAACWYSQRDRVCRQGLQPECRVPRT